MFSSLISRQAVVVIVATAGLCMCSNAALKVEKGPFGTVDGKAVELYTLTNNKGMEMKVTNYGCIVTSLKVPDKAGKAGDVVLGYGNVDSYVKNQGNPYFGAAIGRYGNRIGGAKFTLEGKEYQIGKNDGPNHLHGGMKGYDKVVWDAKEINGKNSVSVEFSYISKDGEEGFPGTLTIKITYSINDKNEFKIDYSATTDKKTICNLTHHSYFNLAGEGTSDILGHELMIKASKYTPIDSTLITTGELAPVTGTPFDFLKSTAVGSRIGVENIQLKYGSGYDHNWVLDRPAKSKDMLLAATIAEPKSGRYMDVLTTEPGLQFYSGNFLDGTITGKSGLVYKHRSGFCLESQHFPDSPNKPEFPSTVLKPGETYKTSTVYKFYTK
ncbi:MAG TPA: aldose epimerase family protein [Chitinispirillaceae bacterium]|nr:aldose epimerase family protein [Chitinispirillaceae bacterium]